MNQEMHKTAMDLLVKIIGSDFAEFYLDDELEEDTSLFAVDTGWFEVTPEERKLIGELLEARRKPPEPFVESGKG